ncbi:hypothetical protein [Prosthecobacter sp.]|uniref:hypothetical protein n=1 Tax=Prosthecobacter sp. TaxID=1965333 RepID=UPI002AB85407|nr:hypothetical protein [Prosthecobacter sp.]MDZ4404370.1 hypothetical protein [Prosthecobacter sp.]
MAQQLPQNLQTRYDKASRRLFSLLGSTAESYFWDGRVSYWAGQVVEMQPEQQRITSFHAVPAMGSCFTVKDGRIHVGLGNRGTIVSRALNAQAWEPGRSVGTSADGRPMKPIDLAVADGTALETLLVARQDAGYSGDLAPLCAIQGGVMLPDTAAACNQVVTGGAGRVLGVRFVNYQSSKLMRYTLGTSGLFLQREVALAGELHGVLHYSTDTCFYHKYRISLLSDTATALYGTPPPFGGAQVEGAVPDPSLNRLYWLDAYAGKLNTDIISAPSGISQKNWFYGSQRGDAYGGIFRWGDYGLVTASSTQLVFSEHAGFIPPPPVTVTLPESLAENGNTMIAGGSVSIPRPESSPLTVNLVSSHPTALQIPATVIIPAGALTASFDITPISDPSLTGPKEVAITGSANLFTSTTAITWVTDVQSTVITLSVPAMLAENAGYSFTAGSLSIGQALPAPLQVLVSSNHPTVLGVVYSTTTSALVTIPAGQTSVTFGLGVNDNSLLDGDKAVTLTATVPGWSAATAALVVQDNEVPALDFMSYPVEVRESAGAGLGLYLTFGGTLVAPLTVSLSSSDITEMEFEQSQVTVPAGSESVTVYLKIIDDDLIDGVQNLTLTASAPGFTAATKTAIIRDNEVGALVWGNVGGPVTAGAVLNTEITAQTIDGDPLTYNGQITFSAGGRPLSPLTQTGTGAVAMRLFQAGTTTLTATLGSITATAPPVEVVAGEAGGFQWSGVPSTVLQNTPFTAQIHAFDLFGNAITSFNGTAGLSARAPQREAQIGGGSSFGGSNPVLNTAFTHARSQILLRSFEVGAAGKLTAISLNLASLPSRAFDDLTIRLKHTSLTLYPAPTWESSGWTTVRSGPWMPLSMGWVLIPLLVPFDYDGVSSLLVDVSFANDAPSQSLLCMETYASGSRAMQFGSTSSSYGPPTTWANSSPTPSYALRPDIRLEFGRLVSVSPLTTSSFVNGVWSGELTLDGTSSAGVVLQAAAGSATGRSASFELGRLPLAVPVFIAEPSYTAGLSNTVAWQGVEGAGAYLVQQASDSSFSSVLADSDWIAGTSHLFAGLADDTAFYYRVKNRRADDPAVESAWSSFTSSTQDDNVPALTVSNLTVQGEIQSSRPAISIRASYVDSTSPGGLSCSATVPGILNSTIAQQTGEGWTGAWTSQINMPASGSAQATVTATDAVGQTSQLIITLVRLTDANSDSLSDEWQQSSGLLVSGLSTEDIGPLGDPDHDGMNNFMEMARGSHPLSTSTVMDVIARQPGTFWSSTVLSFERRRGIDTDLKFEPQSSTDLSSWSPVTNLSETVVPNPDGLTERVTWSMPDSIGGGIIIFGLGGGITLPSAPSKKFFKIQVSVRPPEVVP